MLKIETLTLIQDKDLVAEDIEIFLNYFTFTGNLYLMQYRSVPFLVFKTSFPYIYNGSTDWWMSPGISNLVPLERVYSQLDNLSRHTLNTEKKLKEILDGIPEAN